MKHSNCRLAFLLTAMVGAATIPTAASAADEIWSWNDDTRALLAGARDRISEVNFDKTDASNELEVSYQHYRSSGGSRGTVTLAVNRPLADTATDARLYYSVYFPSDFRWGAVDGTYLTQGAKLLGLAPKSPLTGCATTENPDRWSVRVGWEPASTKTVKPRLYYYPYDRTSSCGETAVSLAGEFENDRWYDIQLRVTLGNEVGKDTVRLYVDGVKVSEVTKLTLRGPGYTEASEIATLMFNTLIGTSRRETDVKLGEPYSLYLDDLRVVRIK